MPSSDHAATEGNDNPSHQLPQSLTGVVTHVAVTDQQVRIILLAAPEFKPARCYVNAADDGPVYDKTRFVQVGDSIIAALAPSGQTAPRAWRASEVWTGARRPAWVGFAPMPVSQDNAPARNDNPRVETPAPAPEPPPATEPSDCQARLLI